MPTVFSSFDSTPATLVADVKARILLSSDWTSPTGNRVVATTTRGAAMVVDLADAAATAARMQIGVYRTAALADKRTSYLFWRGSGGATTDPVHVRVSAGKDHLYIDIEGPRVGEANPESASLGSTRCPFFLGDLVPYFASDTVPAVVLVASSASSTSYQEETAYVSRNQGDSASWVPAHLASLHPPAAATETGAVIRTPGGVQRVAAADGKTYLFPYVVFETSDGLRGRIGKAFFAGFNAPGVNTTSALPPALFSRVTYGADSYQLLAVERYASTVVSPFGRHDNGQGSAVVAIPYA